MKFTKKIRDELLERFSYTNRDIEDVQAFGVTKKVYMIKMECPLCGKYEGECSRCKLIHSHECLHTLEEINGGRLHFVVSRKYISWTTQDMDVVEEELRKIWYAIRNSDIMV